MKRFCSIMFSLLIAGTCALAQEFPTRIVGVNAGLCPSCSPQIGGGAWFANRILGSDHPTYSFSLFNVDKVQVTSWKPLDLQVVTSAETGIAQHITKFNRFDVLALGTGGIATDSANTGFSLNGGGMAMTPVGKKGWLLGGYFRAGKQTIVDKIGWKVGLTVALGSN